MAGGRRSTRTALVIRRVNAAGNAIYNHPFDTRRDAVDVPGRAVVEHWWPPRRIGWRGEAVERDEQRVAAQGDSRLTPRPDTDRIQNFNRNRQYIDIAIITHCYRSRISFSTSCSTPASTRLARSRSAVTIATTSR